MFNMLVTANRTFPVIIIMLTCVAANRANTRRRVVSMPRSIDIPADFASMRTLVLMLRMFVAAYRANAVFVIMSGRFMSNAANFANMSGIVIVSGMCITANRAYTVLVDMFERLISSTACLANVFGGILVIGMLVAADSAGAAVVIVRTFFTAHCALARSRIVIVCGHYIAAYRANMRTRKIMSTFLAAHDALTCCSIVIVHGHGITADRADVRTRKIVCTFFTAHGAFARCRVVIVIGHSITADSTDMRSRKIVCTFFAAHGALARCRVVIVIGRGISADSADMRTFVIVHSMFIIAYRTNAVLVFMLTCVAANRADPRFGIENVPRSIGVSANFASMRTLVLMRRMLVIAYRARAVFVNMSGRFMSNAADFADMCGIVIVSGVLITAYSTGAAVVIMRTFFAAHRTFSRFGIVVMLCRNKSADCTLVRSYEAMLRNFMRLTANHTFVRCVIHMLVIVGHGRVFRKRIRQCGTVRRDEPAAAETCDGFGDVPGAYAFAAAADRYTVHQTVAEE